MSDNLKRILTLLEHLSLAKDDGMQVAHLVEETGLAASTVYRLVNDLENLGYVRKVDDRRLIPNFSFEQTLSISGMDLQNLNEACRSVSESLIAASEFISMRRQNLFWHISEEHPQQPIRLRASVGFIRGSYELDCISRMALAHLPTDDVEGVWDVSGFYAVGVSGGKVSWSTAKAQIAAVKLEGMEFDLMGNAKGVRRYCVAVNGSDGRLAGLLTVAEAATPLRDVEGHVAKVRAVLLGRKEAIEKDWETTTNMIGQSG
ncbi:MAG: helix-turn-helix domain-containing protein [Roseobacter sp.]